MSVKENRDIYIRVRVTQTEKDNFDRHCKKHSYVPSKRLRIIIDKELKGEIK